jgi:CshA-type fibril repeat protein
VTYQAKDSLNRFVASTITPTVGPPPPPEADADAITDDYDTNQTYTPLDNDTDGAADFPLLANSVKLCGIDDPATSGTDEAESPDNCTKASVTIPGEGTYSVNSDGTVTFDPLPTFTGTATPIKYVTTDSKDQKATSTITPIILPPAPPSASPDSITTNWDVSQTYSPLSNDTANASFPLLANSVKLCASNESPNNCSQTTLIVVGEGTYTVNSDGTVSFDPLPTFTGTATAVKYHGGFCHFLKRGGQ